MLGEGSQFSYCQQITPETQKLGGGGGVGVGCGMWDVGGGGKKEKIRKIGKKKPVPGQHLSLCGLQVWKGSSAGDEADLSERCSGRKLSAGR